MLSNKDKAVLERLLQKDELALREFYLEHKNALMEYLLRQLEYQDAEEVFQDSFIAFIEALRSFKGQASLKTFLYSIAKRKAIDKIRKKRVKKILFSHLPSHIVDSLAIVFLKDDLDKKHIAHKIEMILSKLPNDYALVLRLKYKEGYKVAEISEKVKLPFKATESLLFRARKAFIEKYSSYERQGLFTFEGTLR
ncbi:hypothetical protein A3H80_02025 [Candidatus Roizmanbacteria bacterium RIFCSPLOWO2_02_FULL_37_19]|uniref:RNA polymerase sigma-70 region 2 domain-containing protein n=1 Tax=Candidatus Roizmanbacteria bacterium RIFCSPHIGHO2_02_FULL_37_24 TaxID=1802037 RepID=A0A1F7H1B0_9BACT|nr:MAG: hypothetical protein A2862_02610 [Candidatus Roizmanbacteria bacterium RIFCSPHIGHO2_01_FULL_38_41]OGK24512.1 MAG: hypothetical protein A3C24_03105 [Candidatus Roizmanbacteria bacterium RIFCSPHIGHO2_02_FULL_37_24]OGK31966.1 MAG: hypothetical protein A3E10_04445 [Candidatus Roizmanbacteria bacterium RIFCSPHIGHO2_12_FULL_37_23]OGK43767.1 MAG: hypothetical protein A2956_04570 [Candidatus Roizmanbacteria bacterium RIFCSPLOWO2_01_FULL_37_57]OGK54321.1 MAG: hypothetical protein A3H80_02025 [Ca